MEQKQAASSSSSSLPLYYLAGAREDEYEVLAQIYTSSTMQQALGALIFRPTATPEDKTAMQLLRIRKAMRAPGSAIVTARRSSESSSLALSTSCLPLPNSGSNDDEILGYILWSTVLNESLQIEDLSATPSEHNHEEKQQQQQQGEGGDESSSMSAVEISDLAVPSPTEHEQESNTNMKVEVKGKGNEGGRMAEEGSFDAINLLNIALAEEIVANIAAMHDADMRGIRHIFLNHLYVKPRAAGQGIGIALSRACLQEADRQRLPVYVSASPSAAPLYRKCGFVETRHHDFDLARFAPRYGGYGVYRETHLLRPAPAHSLVTPTTVNTNTTPTTTTAEESATES